MKHQRALVPVSLKTGDNGEMTSRINHLQEIGYRFVILDWGQKIWSSLIAKVLMNVTKLYLVYASDCGGRQPRYKNHLFRTFFKGKRKRAEQASTKKDPHRFMARRFFNVMKVKKN